MKATREKFRKKVDEVGGPAAAALSLGCTPSFVHMVISGVRRPGMVTARAIEALFGIPMQEWVEEPRVEVTRRVLLP